MSTLMTVVTTLGWIGALAGVLAYAMVSRGRWSADSLAFQLTNLAGAGAMLAVAAVNGVWPSAAANMAWLVIGASAVFALGRARSRGRNQGEAGSAVEQQVA